MTAISQVGHGPDDQLDQVGTNCIELNLCPRNEAYSQEYRSQKVALDFFPLNSSNDFQRQRLKYYGILLATTSRRGQSMNDNTIEFVAAADPPPGWVPNFKYPEDVYHTIVVSSHGLSLMVMTLFFAARLYVKLVIKRGELLMEDCRSITHTL